MRTKQLWRIEWFLPNGRVQSCDDIAAADRDEAIRKGERLARRYGGTVIEETVMAVGDIGEED